MATIINADTSNGLKLTSDTSGEIKLQSAGADIVSVTANGMAVDTNTLYVDATNNKIGIGTSSPATPLEVVGAVNSTYFTGGSDTINGRQLTLSCESQGGQDNATHRLTVPSGYGDFATSVAGAERMRINSSGNVLINATSSVGTGKFQSANNSGYCSTMYSIGNNAEYIQFWNGSEVGSIRRNGGTAVSYNTSSDYRLKENVSPMSNSIDRLKQLKPSTWSWVQDGSHGEGFLAHEAQEVVPESVHGTKDAMRTEEYEVTPAVLDDDGNVVTEAVMGTKEVPDYQGIDQSKLVPLLTAALQEAITKIEDLETRIQALENA
jgi:hypothetical protein